MKLVERATVTEVVISNRSRQEQKSLGLRTLVPKVGSPRLIEVEWQVLGHDSLQTFGHALDRAGEFTRRTLAVYGVENPTFAIIVITVCSLGLNFPGLRLHV